nr:MAG TPA_asm: hypothetical protein [Caudoviricetes sp.]
MDWRPGTRLCNISKKVRRMVMRSCTQKIF